MGLGIWIKTRGLPEGVRLFAASGFYELSKTEMYLMALEFLILGIVGLEFDLAL